jgi:hypothetical protein
LIAGAASAQIPLGVEIAVNTFTSGQQSEPAVALRTDGGFAVAWQSDDADGDGLSVGGRLFDANGVGLDDEFGIADQTTSAQGLPAIGVDGAGNFVAAWRSLAAPGDNSSYGVSARQFDADATPVDDEFLVNVFLPGNQHTADIAVASGGDFVVVWQDDGQTAEGQIYLRTYGAGGGASSGAILVSQTTGNFRARPVVAMDALGNIVVVWQCDEVGQGINVYARRFDADGDPLGGEFRVNTTVAGQQQLPDVAVRASGEFVVVWQGGGQDGDGDGIFAQRYLADGSPSGGELRVNLGTAGNQLAPSVGVADDGTTIVAFRDNAPQIGILARAFDASGAFLGGDFRVSNPTPTDDGAPSIAVAADGDFVVAWESDGYEGGNYGIRARRFAGNFLFRDGFESGNTAAWSFVLP